MVPLLTGSREVRFEVVPGGHLGMITGRAARATTWTAIDEWVAQWSGAAAPAKKTAAKKTAATKTAAKKTAAKKTAAKKTAAKKAPAKKAPAKKATRGSSASTIGSNPSRRYGSAGSRALGRP